MTMWDATRAELRQALEQHGYRPLDDEHVLTCAIEAIREMGEQVQDAVSPSEYARVDEARDDLEKEASTLREQLDDAYEDISDLRADIRRLEDEVKDLQAAVKDDGAALVERTRAAEAREAEAHEKSSAFLMRLKIRLQGILTQAERSRTDKDYIRHNARDMLQQIEREIGQA